VLPEFTDSSEKAAKLVDWPKGWFAAVKHDCESPGLYSEIRAKSIQEGVGGFTSHHRGYSTKGLVGLIEHVAIRAVEIADGR